LKMILIFALAAGCALAVMFDIYIPAYFIPYAAMMILASLDSLLGAYTASLRGKYDFTIFITGFFGNALISALLIFFGKKVGLDLYLAASLVFVMRIFQNFAIARRIFLKSFIKNHDNDKISEKNE